MSAIEWACGNCVYFHGQPGTKSGTCTRHAPRPIVLPLQPGALSSSVQAVVYAPKVNEGYHCGEFALSFTVPEPPPDPEPEPTQ